MIKIVLVLKNIHAAFDRIFLKNVVNLFQIALSIFPDEDDRNSFERIDKGKEETMNEIVMMRWVKVVEGSHERNQNLSKFLLTISSNTC